MTNKVKSEEVKRCIRKCKNFIYGIAGMADHVNEHYGEIKKTLTATSMMVAVNDHPIQLERSISERRREYEILIDAIFNLQNLI
jgi:hypothetical protein